MQINTSSLYNIWTWLKNKPAGPWLFNVIIRFVNPYTGTLKATVIILEKGHARIELKDRRAIRNHLNSIHAIALTNLGEFCSGLALLTCFNNNVRGIPININIQFIKKARGRLIAECKTELPVFNNQIEHSVMAEIKNSDNEVVSVVNVIWKLSYKQD